ncbi:Tripartite-type tricarboxylate transporter, receptor component TctC [Alteribacillus persepolensis]|uniref:Tripartite-type tricarboxylate transporter, receptor component TctC n=1 Tax=Alteribacillus persepolensis TaxID=568899 RepID=A0A1G8BYY0_9BACI|nr:tripartite tricarboxylate transporter substrate binding protein [Alteribacillus persepolensis]SDH38345.1 Tripartite-type tricarboxylate transporter, receptor component TctC [Alteribacillus persepolensis]
MKKWFSLYVLVLSMLVLGACASTDSSEEADASAYPKRDISGIIQWGEGGSMDIISRTIAPIAEEEMGTSLVMENREGASGAIGAQYVYDQPADGYTLLFGAENPNLYQVLDISERDYMNDFTPVTIMSQSYAGVIVRADSEFNTLEQLVDYAKENPNDLTMGTSGEGGLPQVATAMLTAELDTQFNRVPYDGEGPIANALLGGEVDASIVTVSAAQEYVESGDFRMLAVVHDEQLEATGDTPPITDIYPQFEKYLPWGPFQGVFVKKETPDDIVDALTESFTQAQQDEEFQRQLKDLGMQPLNLSGEEAIEFVNKNRSTSTWMLHDAGVTEHSPEEFDIPRVEE